MKKNVWFVLLFVCLFLVIASASKGIWSITATDGVTLYLHPKLKADVRVTPKIVVDSMRLKDSLFVKYNQSVLPIIYLVDSSITYSLQFVSSQKDTILFPIYTKTSSTVLPNKF